MVMKNYKIVASKEPVAKFEIDMQVITMKFGCCAKCGEWIITQHPELKDTPWDYDIYAKKAVFVFYSIGNLVIEEV